MKVKHKSPQPKIEIYNYDAPKEPEYVLSASKTDYTHLLSYSFSESVEDLNGSFSFSISGGDNNLFNEIKPLQIVKIYEGTERPCFTGIISSRTLNCSMSDSGVRRSINFSGKSITSLIANFQLIMDIKFLDVLNIQDSETLNKDLKLQINELQSNELLTVKKFLEITWNAYLKYTGFIADNKKALASNIIVFEIIKNFLTLDFFEIHGTNSLPIPIANTFFNQDINTVLQIWQTILTPPVYEIFSRVNDNGQTKIVVRETPFDSDVWNNLDIKSIKAHDLTDYSIRLSNDEVYTAFLSYIEGSELSSDQYVAIQQTEGANKREKILQIDEKKLSIYGVRFCRVNFHGYERNKQGTDTTIRAMQKLSMRLCKWYEKLDEMYLGSASIINDFTGDYIRCGERINFLGGQFYVLETTHSWSYGAVPKIEMQLSRGAVYNGVGEFVKTIPDMGKSRIELKE